MSNLAKLQRDAAIINERNASENTKINDAIADTKADFAQYDGISLDSPYTTLSIDTDSYNGTTNNAIDISLDGGSTTFTTVTVHADGMYNINFLYYKARYVEYDGTMNGGDNLSHVTAPTAYAMLKALGIHKIMD